MNDRALVQAGIAGTIFAAICCSAPLLAAGLSLAGLGAWLAGVGLVVLPLALAGSGLVAWVIHHGHAKAASCETKIHKEGVKS